MACRCRDNILFSRVGCLDTQTHKTRAFRHQDICKPLDASDLSRTLSLDRRLNQLAHVRSIDTAKVMRLELATLSLNDTELPDAANPDLDFSSTFSIDCRMLLKLPSLIGDDSRSS